MGKFQPERVLSDADMTERTLSATWKEVQMKDIDHNTDSDLLRLKQVLQIIPISRSKIYADIKAQRFPAPCKFGRLSFWRRSDVAELVKSITKES